MKACNQCGKCCLKYGASDLVATQDEIDLWEIFNPEIFQFVNNNKIWFDPKSGQRFNVCPFLGVEAKLDEQAPDKYTCSIYLNRPEDCRLYPSHVAEMVRDECEMIEVVDLENTKKAQQQLDLLMEK